jgi:hypothetical protein
VTKVLKKSKKIGKALKRENIVGPIVLTSDSQKKMIHYFENVVKKLSLRTNYNIMESSFSFSTFSCTVYARITEAAVLFDILKSCFQGSISPMFYEQLLCEQIPKAQKDNDDLTVFLCLWDLRV